MPKYYQRSDGVKITLPDDVTPQEVEQIADHQEQLLKAQLKPAAVGPIQESLGMGGVPRSPFPEGGEPMPDSIRSRMEAAPPESSLLGRGWETLNTPNFGRGITPEQHEAFKQALPSLPVFGGLFGAAREVLPKSVSEPIMELGAGFVENSTTPLNLGLLGAGPAARLAGAALPGRIAPAVKGTIAGLERLANAGLMTEGGLTLTDAWSRPDLSTSERFKMTGAALLEGLGGLAGLAVPGAAELRTPKETFKGKITATPEARPIELINGPRMPQTPEMLQRMPAYLQRATGEVLERPTLQLPAAGGTTVGTQPRFYAGDRGVADTMASVYREAPEIEARVTPQPMAADMLGQTTQPIVPPNYKIQPKLVGTAKQQQAIDISDPSRFEGTVQGSPQRPDVATMPPEVAAPLRAVGDPTLTGVPVVPPTDPTAFIKQAFKDKLQSRMNEAARKMMLRTGEPHAVEFAPDLPPGSTAETRPTAPTPKTLGPGEGGTIDPTLLRMMGGGTIGGAIGGTQGDTPQERLRNILLGMGVGATAAGLGPKAARNELGQLGPLTRAAEGSEWAAPFYSRLGRAVEALPEKATAQEMLARLKKQPFNPAEDEYVGISEWLSRKDPKAPVTRQEVRDFFEKNQLVVEEVEYSSNHPARKALEAKKTQLIKEHERVLRQLMAQDPDGVRYTELYNRYGTLTGPERDELYNLGETIRPRLENHPNAKAISSQVDRVSDQIAQLPVRDSPRWERYSLPGEGNGGENYREMVFHWKPTEAQHARATSDRSGMGGDTEVAGVYETPDGTPTTNAAYASLPGSHAFPGEGQVGWARFHDRIDPRTGKKVRFIDEIQSDWGQDLEKYKPLSPEQEAQRAALQAEFDQSRARLRGLTKQLYWEGYQGLQTKRGWDKFYPATEESLKEMAPYNSPEAVELYRQKYFPLAQERLALQRRLDQLVQEPLFQGFLTPTQMPFAKGKMDWDKLIFRRMQRLAAEEGIDTIQWTTADQQVSRSSERQRPGMRDFYDTRMPNVAQKDAARMGGGEVGKGEVSTSAYPPGSAGGRQPVNQLAMSPEMVRNQLSRGNELGAISPALAVKLGGGVAGAAYGASDPNDTPVERIKKALLYGGLGYFGASQLLPRQKPISKYVVDPNMRAILQRQDENLWNRKLNWQDSKMLTEQLKAGARLKLQKFADATFNQLGPVIRAQDKTIEQIHAGGNKGFGLTPEEDAYIQGSLALGGGGGQVVNRLRTYKDLWSAIKDANLEDEVKAILNYKGFGAAMAAIKEKRGGAARVAAGETVPSKYTPESVAAGLASMQQSMGPQLYAKADAFASQIHQLNRGILDEAKARGLVSQANYDRVINRANSGDYVPMLREIDDLSVVHPGSKLNVPTTFWKKLTGSERMTIHPIYASMIRASEVIKEANRNEAVRSLVDLTKKDAAFRDWIKPVGTAAASGPDWTEIFYFKDGVRQKFLVPNEVGRALNLATGREVSMMGSILGSKLLQPAAAGLRATATLINPFFAGANVPRDISDYLILGKGVNKLSDVPKVLFQEWPQAFLQVWKESPEYQELLESRAGFSTLQRALTPDHFTAITAPHGKWSPAQLIDWLIKIPDVSENATKLMAYKRLRAQGLSKDAAAWETRRYGGSPDFAQHGYYGPELGLYFMFINAQIQGIGRLGRVFTDASVAKRALFGATALSLGVARWNTMFRDEDGTLSITHTKPEDNANYIMMVNPFDHAIGDDGVKRFNFISIPKGHTLKILMNPMQEGLDKLLSTSMKEPELGKKSAEQLALDAVSNIAPGNFNLQAGDVAGSAQRGAVASMNPALQVPFSLAMDRDMAFNTPVLGRLKDVPVEERYDTRTSPSVRAVAEALQKIPGMPESLKAPKSLQFVLEKTGAKLGATEIPYDIIDKILRGTGNAPQRLEKPAEESFTAAARNTPVLGGLAKRFLKESTSQGGRVEVDAFYRLAERAKQAATAYNMIKRMKDEPRMQEFLNRGDNIKLVKANPQIQQMVRDISALRNQQEAVRSQGVNTPEARRQIEALGAKINELLQRTTGMIDWVAGTSSVK